jgi:helix-turn-helix protein
MNARPVRRRRSAIDRFANRAADQLEADAQANDEAYSTVQAADKIPCSPAHLEALRCKGGGPPFIRLGPKMIRYLKSDLIAWLRSRERHLSTAEYSD